MTNKQKILKRLKNVIRGQALVVREDVTLTQEEKIEQMQELSEIMKYIIDRQREEKQININKLKEDIEKQTRNGRTQVYIKVADLNILTDKKEISEEDRIFLDADYVKELINTYEYKNSVKYKLDEELER